MFSLSNNGNDPISYITEQAANNMPFFSDIISNSKQYVPPPLSFCHLPSPFFAYDQLELEGHPMFLQQNYDLLLEQQPMRATATTSTTQSSVVNNLVDSNKNDVIELTQICNKQSNSISTHDQIPRKRSSKRDRHSKINTAQGPRDRRMRLSLKVARDFFDLQDKLRFDKASKTVEWLLIQAKNEIKKVSSGFLPMNYSCTTVETKSASSTSECEVLSEINIKGSNIASKGKSSVCGRKERKTTSRASRKSSSSSPFAKESREKARARARERTKEKLRSSSRRLIDESKLCESDQETKNELNQFTGFETAGDQESGTHHNNINPSLDVQLEEVEAPIYHEQEQLGTTAGMLDETFVSMGHDWSPPFPNHLHNKGIHQEHQFTDFQYNLYKTWDDDQAYNNIDGMC